MPQYQGVWTLPVAARLQSNQQWATDPLYRNTTLLLQADNAANGAQNNTFLDSSSNNFTITRNGNTTQGTFTPFSQSPGWWGNYFDGTGDALTTNTTNSGWQLGTGDFEIAFWIYPESVTGNRDIFTQRNASGTPQIFLVNNVLRYNNALIAGILDATITIVPNKWQYCVLSRVSGTTRWFIDGVAAGSVADTNNWSSTNSWWVSSTAQSFQGYISNIRLVKGSGVTSSAVPTAPLTAISGTTFLSCQSNRFVDNSTNSFELTANGNVSVQAFSPFAPQYQYTPSVTGGSGYFDGTGDYLNLAVQSFTGDFTVEAWIYPTRLSDSGGSGQIFSYDVINIQFATDSAGNLIYYNNSISTSATAAISLNSWQHVALCRSGSTTRIFVNGILRATNASDSGTRAFSAIGQFASGGAYLFQGYMSSVRWAATAVYTSNFTPPTAPLTAITNTSLLLNFTNAGIYDGTLKNNLETAGNAQISTSVVKYGTGSIAFDGTGDYLTSNTATTDLYAFGSGDFTIECWVYLNSVVGLGIIYDGRPTTAQTTQPTLFHSGGTIAYYTNGANRIVGSALSTSTWYHIALARSGTSTKLFVDGTQVGSTYTDSTVYTNTSGRPWIGADSYSIGNNLLNGYIDDLRVTKGVARYTANFTPPTVALPRQ